MSWGYLPKTVTRMDAGAEPPGRVLRRVLGRYPQLMSRTGCNESCSGQVFLATIHFKHIIISVNRTAVIYFTQI